MNRPQGFTQVELLTTLAVVALIAGVALPAVRSVVHAAEAGDAKSALLESLVAASTRAAFSGSHAVLCPSTQETRCDRDSPDWSPGWLVFLDRNANRELDAGETTVRRQPALSGDARLFSTSGRTRIVFQGNGGNAGSNVTFTLCDGRGPAKAQHLVISNFGRLRSTPASLNTAMALCSR